MTETASTYELVCGMEIHVQLNTNTKIFSSDSAAFGAAPNHHISAVSLALPGALPKLNKEVVRKAIQMGLALNCEIHQRNYFDRKNYFYADLPKGFQTSQDTLPACGKGFLTIKKSDGSEKNIGITRIHIEEDAGKSIHDQDPTFTFVDLNRAGVPLIEIVTEPDIRSAEEAALVLAEIRKIAKYLQVSDGNMEEGSIRCDANVSVRKFGDTQFNTRCEIKNLNSTRFLKKAVEYEYARQVNAYETGERIIQSTLTFDTVTETTSAIRTKEEANDYRYFPEPDLPPIVISDAELAKIKAEMPALPNVLKAQLCNTYQLSENEVQILIDEPSYLQCFSSSVAIFPQAKMICNWLNGAVRAYCNEHQIEELHINAESFVQLLALVHEGKITQQNAIQQVLPKIFSGNSLNIEAFIAENNLIIDAQDDDIVPLVHEVFQKFEAQVKAYQTGKKGVLGLFVGEVMKLSQGKANPKKVNEIIINELNKIN